MMGKVWAGLCALQLLRQQQPSPPRLEIMEELGGRDDAAEDRDEGAQEHWVKSTACY